MDQTVAVMIAALVEVQEEDQQRQQQGQAQDDVAGRYIAAEPTAQASPASAADGTGSHSMPVHQYIASKTADDSETAEEEAQAAQDGSQPLNPAHLHPAGAAAAHSTHRTDRHLGRAADMEHRAQEPAEDLVMSEDQFWECLAQHVEAQNAETEQRAAPAEAELSEPTAGPASNDSTQGAEQHLGKATQAEHPQQDPAEALEMSDEQFDALFDGSWGAEAQETQEEQHAAATFPAETQQQPPQAPAAEGLNVAQGMQQGQDAAAPVYILWAPVHREPNAIPWFVQDAQSAQRQQQHDHLLQLTGREARLARLAALRSGDYETVALMNMPSLHQLWVRMHLLALIYGAGDGLA